MSEEVEYPVVLYKIKDLKKCSMCKKRKGKILIVQDSYDDYRVAVRCVSCFKKELPEYTLENMCIVCKDNLKCDIQKILFSSKEIKQFIREFNIQIKK